MKTICLYIEIHQIIHLKRYRFFDIGTDHYYYDDYENERSISDIAERSYMPALTALEDMIKASPNLILMVWHLSSTRRALKPKYSVRLPRWRNTLARSHRCCATLHSSIAMISVCRLHRWVLPACLPRVPSMCWDGSLLTMFTTALWLQSSSSCCVMCA